MAPRTGENDHVVRGTCLWVRCEGGKQLAALKAFGARPTLILQEGSLKKATALWMLERDVDVDVMADLNRRLAFGLGAVQKHGAVRGTWAGLRRIGRCHPWNPGGFDPP